MVKLDTLVSYQIRLYNINALFYSGWIYYQNFIFYVFISWLLHRNLQWETRIPSNPRDKPRDSWRVNSSCFSYDTHRVTYICNNTDPTKPLGWTQELMKEKQFLLFNKIIAVLLIYVTTRTPPKPGDEHRSTWRINCSCFSYDTRRVTYICNNTDPTKTRGWTQELLKDKQFLLLIRRSPCYLYI